MKLDRIFLTIAIISFILFIISLSVQEKFTESDNIFPVTKITDSSHYGKIKCFDNNDYVSSIILKGDIWENDIYQNIFKKYMYYLIDTNKNEQKM